MYPVIEAIDSALEQALKILSSPFNEGGRPLSFFLVFFLLRTEIRELLKKIRITFKMPTPFGPAEIEAQIVERPTARPTVVHEKSLRGSGF
jgi:hypothetical protein